MCGTRAEICCIVWRYIRQQALLLYRHELPTFNIFHVSPFIFAVTCGDGICNSDRSESCSNCPTDCGFCEGDDLRNACPDSVLSTFDNSTLGVHFDAQWHLLNTGQSQSYADIPRESGTAGEDINVLDAWRRNIYGRGVTVSIVDDGVQSVHHSLQCGFDREASFDFEKNSKDQVLNLDDTHGTQCAGVAVGRDNATCGVGAAFRANVSGIRLLVTRFSDSLAANALVHALDRIDIYSNSWGPWDDGTTIDRYPHTLKALEYGVTHGREGKGAIYVWAAGNGAFNGDSSSYDELSGSPYTISVAASDWHGRHSVYSEMGTNILVNAPSKGAALVSGGIKFYSNIVTADRIGWYGENMYGDCSFEFGGTSSSCPLVAGVVALMLEANPTLTWRDVQHVLVESANVRHVDDTSWSQNFAGKWYSPKYGFGRVDAGKAVQIASQWRNVCPLASTIHITMNLPADLEIPSSVIAPLILSVEVENRIKVEHVVVRVSVKHPSRGQGTLTQFKSRVTLYIALTVSQYFVTM